MTYSIVARNAGVDVYFSAVINPIGAGVNFAVVFNVGAVNGVGEAVELMRDDEMGEADEDLEMGEVNADVDMGQADEDVEMEVDEDDEMEVDEVDENPL